MTEPPADVKWSCEYCTYKNFPSSLKCTMCRGPKPYLNEDIFRLHGSDVNGERDINTNLSGKNSLLLFPIKIRLHLF